MVIADVALVFSLAAHVRWGWHLLAAALVFGGLAWWVCRDLGTVSLPALLVITVAVQATGLLVFPLTSDDIYRYVWDGRVQLAGIDPYRFVPLDPALAFLRDAQLFPPGGAPAINRPGVHTIYPPGAQAVFTAVAFVVPAPLGLAGLRVLAGVGGGDHHRAARPVPGSAARPRAALRRQPAGHDRGGQRRPPRRPGGAGRARRGLVHGQPAALVGRPVPGSGRLAQARAVAAGPGPAASGPLADQSDGGGRSRSPATCRTCWWWAALVLGYLPGYLAEEGYDSGGRFALLGWLPAEVRPVAALGDRRRARRAGLRPVRSRPGAGDLLLAVRGQSAGGHPRLPLVRAAARRAGDHEPALGVAGGVGGGVRGLRLRPLDRRPGRGLRRRPRWWSPWRPCGAPGSAAGRVEPDRDRRRSAA